MKGGEEKNKSGLQKKNKQTEKKEEKTKRREKKRRRRSRRRRDKEKGKKTPNEYLYKVESPPNLSVEEKQTACAPPTFFFHFCKNDSFLDECRILSLHSFPSFLSWLNWSPNPLLSASFSFSPIFSLSSISSSLSA